MKALSLVLLVFFILGFTSCSREDLNRFLDSPLTESDAAAGIREALTLGSSSASDSLSRVDSYYRSAFRIPFPPEATRVSNALTGLGLGSLVDDIVLTVNRAAEDAAVKAKPIFVEAIRGMSIADAVRIVRGRQNEATEYLKSKTHQKLVAAYAPSINASLDKVNATRYWSQAMTTYNNIPFVEPINPDLGAYVTAKALDGLFAVVAVEEAKIRSDPAARVTEILRKVFGRPTAH